MWRSDTWKTRDMGGGEAVISGKNADSCLYVTDDQFVGNQFLEMSKGITDCRFASYYGLIA